MLTEEILILSRAVHFGSCLALLAIFAVRLIVEPPALDDGRAARRMAGLCLALAAGSGFLWFWASAAGMNGSGLIEALNWPLFQLVLTQTPPGQAWMFRCGVGVILALLLCFARRGWSWWVGAALAAALVGSIAWLGHAGASADASRPWMLAADVTHLLAASLWPAGLLPFALLLRRRMKAGAIPEARAAVRRFSAISLGAVAVVVASGTVNALFLVGSFHALVSSDYGRLLMVKLALFAAALALGAWNLLIHKPRLESSPGAMAAIARKVWIEAALASLIILVVAILGTLPPANAPPNP